MIRKVAFAAVALAAWTSVATAQQTRAELLRSATTAYDDFAPDRAADLLKAALNPALGPADTAWARGVHLLTQILAEGGKPELAKTWARWAARLAPNMAIDTVNFVAGAVAAMREARTFASARTAGDAVTRTSWRWVPRGSSEARGRIVIDPAGMPVPVNVRVVGVGLVPAGTVGLALPSGSYEVEAAASGYLPARFTREVLPGVTTTLAFSLTSAAVASDVIAENIRQHTFRNVAPLTVRRFGGAPVCAVGSFMSRDGLLLTSYQAIRGADGITAEGTPGGTGTPGVRVAAYDVAADLAVLQLPMARTDSIVPAVVIADGQSGWGIRFPDCRTPADVRVRVAQWADRPRGTLQLSDAPTGAALGSPLVDVEGRLTAIWTAGTAAVPAPRALTLLDAARRNVAQAQLVAIGEVSRRENHAYGSVVITADMTGATARVTPLEPWHWEGLQAGGAAPFTFSGPMGRYRVEVTGPGNIRREQEITIRPGAQERLLVALRAVAVAPQTGVQPKKSNKKIWLLAGIGGVGAAAALALGGGGGGGTQQPPPSTSGSITVQVPVNP
jgi:hypothetical protein